MFFSSSRIILGHLSRQQARTGLLCQVTCVFHMSALPGPGSNVTIHSNGKWPRFTNILVKQKGQTKGMHKRYHLTACLPNRSRYVKNMSRILVSSTCALKSGWPGTNLRDFHVHIDVGDGNPLFLFFFFVKTFCNQMQPIFLLLFSLSLSFSKDCFMYPLKSIISSWRPLRAPTTFSHRRKSAYLYQEILDGLTSAPSSAA